MAQELGIGRQRTIPGIRYAGFVRSVVDARNEGRKITAFIT